LLAQRTSTLHFFQQGPPLLARRARLPLLARRARLPLLARRAS